MQRSLYIMAQEPRSGKSAVVLGIMHLLMSGIPEVAFFRPLIEPEAEGRRDHDIDLVLSEFRLDMAYEDTYACTLDEAMNLVSSGREDQLIEKVLSRFSELREKYDFVLCEGSDFLGPDHNFEYDLNLEIAGAMGTPVLAVTSGFGKRPDETLESTRLTLEAMLQAELDVLAVIINRFSALDGQEVPRELEVKTSSGPVTIPAWLIPEKPSLDKPTVADLIDGMDAEPLYGAEGLDALVDCYVVAAMKMHNFLEYLEPGALVITPGDRSDILLSSLVSRISGNFPDISGILLTGGLLPEKSIRRLIEGCIEFPTPVLTVKTPTYETARRIGKLRSRINPGDQRRIASALGLFETHVDARALKKQFQAAKPEKITPKMFEFSLVQQARSNRQRVVLPEGTEDRILRAADILLRRDAADLILLGEEERIHNRISQLGLRLDKAVIMDHRKSPHLDKYIDTYLELRRHKGIVRDDARDAMSDATYFATMMVYFDHADAMVSGSINTTAHTIRPAFEIIKTHPGATIVSSVFFMCLRSRVLVFGDCAVNPNPTAPQLAEIAIQSAHTARTFGIEPLVAMVSYSSGASGHGEDVDRVREAVAIAREKAPDLALEGPIQYDAAIDPAVARTKMPDSTVAGRATVFIFPDLNTGNTTYKAVQRAAHAVAIGPVLQGLRKPVNDLSRGCTVADIVNTVAITAIQAQQVDAQ